MHRHLTRPSVRIILMAWIAGCAGGAPAGNGSAPGGTGGVDEPPEATGGKAGGTGGRATGGSGGTAVTPDADTSSAPDAATEPDANASAPDVAAAADSNTPMSVEGGAPPSYEGEIPIYYGPEVGPVVKMNCPGDPTEGWTEYQDSFHIERPYDTPVNKRFSITGGIYNFWVFPGDKPHSPIAMGRNPRTEATYGGTYDKANVKGGGGLSGNIGYFTSGQRLYSADMLIERNAIGSAIMQIHTTASGGGPIGLRMQGNGDLVNNGSLTVATGGSVPGGLVNTWFNFKASLNAANTQVQIYINNCLTKTYTGGRGDGHFYFKNGVYFCKTSQNGCFSHYKNVHLYYKQ